MTLIRKKEMNVMTPILESDVSRAFDIDSLFSGSLLKSTLLNNPYLSRVPATNIFEEEEEFVIELAAPGMKKKDFHVHIDNNVLQIEVEREEESDMETENYTRREYDFTSFYRSFKLPELVEPDKINAEYEDGILKIHLPKTVMENRMPAKEIAVK